MAEAEADAEAEAEEPALPPLLLVALSAVHVRAAIARADSSRRREPTEANASERETSDGGVVSGPVVEAELDLTDGKSMRDCAEAVLVAVCADDAAERDDLPSLLADDDDDDDDAGDNEPSCSAYAQCCAAR